MNINITKIQIIFQHGHSDTVLLETDMEPCTYPFHSTPYLKFNTAQGTALEYVKKHFPDIEIELIPDRS